MFGIGTAAAEPPAPRGPRLLLGKPPFRPSRPTKPSPRRSWLTPARRTMPEELPDLRRRRTDRSPGLLAQDEADSQSGPGGREGGR